MPCLEVFLSAGALSKTKNEGKIIKTFDVRISPETKLKKLARAFVHIDKYGAKFRDDGKADAFMKAVDKAK